MWDSVKNHYQQAKIWDDNTTHQYHSPAICGLSLLLSQNMDWKEQATYQN